ncbi:MAG: ABC transporter permease, partial [Chloroflexia bacterium]|nr:ABC transporter permease [Chloroflexia bacterium]
IPHRGSLWLAVLLVLLLALLGVTLGLFLSAFARNEFQAVQFLPAAVIPQFFLSGLIVPVERLPDGLQVVAWLLPLTYAFEALDGTMRLGQGFGDAGIVIDVLVMALASTVFLAAGSLTLRRQSA